MFNGLSVVIWSMIAAKAKTGMNAATSGEAKSVGNALKQAGALIFMIALASGFNIYAQMDDLNLKNVNVPNGAVDAASDVLGKALKQGRGRQLKEVSSHANGGAAASAFAQFEKMDADDFKRKNVEKKDKKSTSERGRKVLSANVPTLDNEPKQASIDLIIDALETKKTKVTPAMKKLRSVQS